MTRPDGGSGGGGGPVEQRAGGAADPRGDPGRSADPGDAPGLGDSPGLDDDRRLLAAHLAGDPDAFAALVRRHQDRLWAVAVRTLGDREEAADALQDALVNAFRRAGQYRGDAAVTTWLHRIVVNACLDRLRRRRLRAAEPLPEEQDEAGAHSAAVEPDRSDQRDLALDVRAALEQLPPEQRAALVLVDMHGCSVEEAAAILDCAPGTVKSRCSRGRARLLPLLADHDPRRPAAGGNRSEGSGVEPVAVSRPEPPAPTREEVRGA
jgi:RNA polymerase sigma-70 factor (ECF subfamily)